MRTCQLFGGTTPSTHLVMLFLMTVWPLVQLGAVGIDPIDEGVPYTWFSYYFPYDVG